MQTDMRKVLPYIILSAAFTLLLGGCTSERLETGLADKDGIVLYFNSGSGVPLTKATSSSVTAYNENKISSVDIFFYPEGQGATTSNAVHSVIGRTVEQVAGNDNLYKTTIRLNATQAEAIFGGTVEGTCKVFVIANASLSYSDTSIPALKQQLIERDFSTQTIQGSFVMYSRDGGSDTDEAGYTVTLSEGKASGRIPMLRVAAKAQLFFKVIESLEDPNTHQTWKPDLAHMKVYLVNGMKRTRIDAPYSPANDGSDYFDYSERDVTDYSTATAGTPEKAVYTEISEAELGSYKYSCEPFYSYPCSWKDIHDHATQYIIDVPWYIDAEGAAPPASRYYQLSANLVDSWFLRNRYYRTFVEINTLGGADKIQSVDIQNCTYAITPWFKEGAGVESGVPVVGTFESQSYLVVEPTKIILNNENYAEFDYLSSSTLNANNTKVIEVRYYDYKNGGKNQIVRTGSAITNDSHTNSSAISVDISQGKVRVTHNLYNNDGSQKIFVEYYIKVRIQNNDGLHEDVEIIQYPPLYVLMKNGDNAFVDGYFRHVMKTGGGAPFTNAYAFTGNNFSAWSGYYKSVSYFQTPSTTTKDSYWYLGIETSTGTNNGNITNGTYAGMVMTPYGNLYSTPGSTDLSLYDITGIKLSAFSDSYHSYTVDIGHSTSASAQTVDNIGQEFEYRIGDPRTNNSFTGNPKLVDYLTGMGEPNNKYNSYWRYNSSRVTTKAWDSDADKIQIATEDHVDNNIIAPYILISSSYLSQSASYGVTFEQAQKRCATYQEGGYPAGRWRLPTEAEMMFLIERQEDNTISTLFNTSTTSSYYWTASGYFMNQRKLYSNDYPARKGAARCVYDAWYWGDDPVEAAAYTYTPMP